MPEGKRVSASSVDYTELPGAVKDADCKHVEVKNGVSRTLGCCNDFDYKKGMQKQFRCGTCEYVVIEGVKPDNFYGA